MSVAFRHQYIIAVLSLSESAASRMSVTRLSICLKFNSLLHRQHHQASQCNYRRLLRPQRIVRDCEPIADSAGALPDRPSMRPNVEHLTVDRPCGYRLRGYWAGRRTRERRAVCGGVQPGRGRHRKPSGGQLKQRRRFASRCGDMRGGVEHRVSTRTAMPCANASIARSASASAAVTSASDFATGLDRSLATHRWPGGAAQGSRYPYPSHKDCAVEFCDSAGRIIRISWALSAACLSCFMWAPDRGGSNPAAMRRPDRPALHPYRHRSQAPAARHLCFRLHREKPILRPTD